MKILLYKQKNIRNYYIKTVQYTSIATQFLTLSNYLFFFKKHILFLKNKKKLQLQIIIPKIPHPLDFLTSYPKKKLNRINLVNLNRTVFSFGSSRC